jgi:hypothetical protein
MVGNEFTRRIVRPLMIAATVVAFIGQSEAVSAATIIWGTLTTVAADGDVDTTGTLVYAYNIGPSGGQSTTINGVVFNAFAFPGQLDALSDSTSQTFNLNSPWGNTSPLINGFQLRTVAVPEPSTFVMATTAVLGLAAASLRRFAGRRSV